MINKRQIINEWEYSVQKGIYAIATAVLIMILINQPNLHWHGHDATTGENYTTRFSIMQSLETDLSEESFCTPEFVADAVKDAIMQPIDTLYIGAIKTKAHLMMIGR